MRISRLISSDGCYDSEIYVTTRNNRSAVESLMFLIKHNFNFDRVVRRGHKNVKAELLETDQREIRERKCCESTL